MSEWIDLKDRLPNEYDKILIRSHRAIWVGILQIEKDSDNKQVLVWWASNPNEYTLKHAIYLVEEQATHWMPLPDPPNED